MEITRLTLPLCYTSGGRPVYPVFGAAPDEDEGIEIEPDEEPEEPEDEPGDEPESGEDGGKKGKKDSGRYVPPSEAEWAKVRASLDRANASAKAKRIQAQELEKRLRELEERETERQAEQERRQLAEQQRAAQQPATGKKGRGAQGGGAAPADLPAGVMTPAQVKAELAKAKRAEREAVQAEYQDIARRSAARVALADAQVPKASIGRLIKLLDLDEVELDADGEVVGGLEEQIETLKTELPQLFATAAPPEPERKSRPRPPRIPQASAAPRPPVIERPRSTAEQMAEAILGPR